MISSENLAYYIIDGSKYRQLKREAKRAYKNLWYEFCKEYEKMSKQGTLIDLFIDEKEFVNEYISEHWNDDEKVRE